MTRVKHELNVARQTQPFVWATPEEGERADALVETMIVGLPVDEVARLVTAACSGDGAPFAYPHFVKNLRAIVLDSITLRRSETSKAQGNLDEADTDLRTAALADGTAKWAATQIERKAAKWEAWRTHEWLWLLFPEASSAETRLTDRLAGMAAFRRAVEAFELAEAERVAEQIAQHPSGHTVPF